MRSTFIPEIEGELRKHMIFVPEVIQKVSGIRVFGKKIRSILFSTDIAIIRNCNADAVIAVYPFTPQPIISESIINCSDVPVFCGVGGGTTRGKRVANLAQAAENLGAVGVVVNAPTENATIVEVSKRIDIPIVCTVVSEHTNIEERLEAGATIINVSDGPETPKLVERIRKKYPKVPILATGGPTEASILATIEAGANAITYTPPSTGEIFREMMIRYRAAEKEK